MKPIIQYTCSVDYYKPLNFKHSTQGFYQVAAKTSAEARELVQKYIKFGSAGTCNEIPEECIRGTYDFSGVDVKFVRLPYKMVMKLC